MNYFFKYVLVFVLMALAMSAGSSWRMPDTIAASSATHLWWISHCDSSNDPSNNDATASEAGPHYKLLHHAAAAQENTFQTAAVFHDRPIAVAADGDQVWLAFAAVGHKMEVVSGFTQFNPASELWFITPGGALQLCASIQGESLESLAAFNGEAWAIVVGQKVARVLRGGQWKSVDLPLSINECERRMLIVAGGVLNMIGSAQDHSLVRFKMENGKWIPSPLSAPNFSYAIDHAARFACVAGEKTSNQMVCIVEAGALAPIAAVGDLQQMVLGLGQGFVSVDQSIVQANPATVATLNELLPIKSSTLTTLSYLPAGATAFAQPVPLQAQASTAGRWYHLPILGVLSLGAIIAAFLVRALNSPLNPLENERSKNGDTDSQTSAQTPWTPFQKWRRVVATAIDVFPCAIASVFILNADVAAILVPPLWSADIHMSIPYIAMVVATVAFSMFEEIAFGRSMGKRLMGGRVVCIDGKPAAWWQHIARNLLKGLVLLSPVLAIPSLLSPIGSGIPDIISRTKVQATDLKSN